MPITDYNYRLFRGGDALSNTFTLSSPGDIFPFPTMWSKYYISAQAK